MKKFYLFLTFLFINILSILAQQRPLVSAVLNSGDTLYSDYIFINNNSTLFAGAHIRLNEFDKKARIPLSYVNAVSAVDRSGKERFFRRVYLPLYGDVLAERVVKTDRVDLLYADVRNVGYSYSYNYRYYYFSKDNLAVKKLDLYNAKREFSNSLESMNHIKKAQGVSVTMGVLLGTGIAMVVAGVAHTSKMNSDLPIGQAPSFSPLLFVGAITANIPFFLRESKYNHLRNAAIAYK